MRKKETETIEATEPAAAREVVTREQTLLFHEDTGFANNFGPRAHAALNRILKEFLNENNYPSDAMPPFSPDLQVKVILEFH